KSFGAFLLAVRLGDQKALEQMGSKFVDWENVGQKATLVTQIGELGGYAVPTEHYGRIYQVVYNKSIVRPRAIIVPQSGRTTEVPVLDHATAQAAGTSAQFGGFAMNWTEEGSTIAETNPKLKQDQLVNYECSGYVPIS